MSISRTHIVLIIGIKFFKTLGAARVGIRMSGTKTGIIQGPRNSVRIRLQALYMLASSTWPCLNMVADGVAGGSVEIPR